MDHPILLYTGRRGETSFHLLFVARRFQEGLTVTGYLIYPDLSKSEIIDFDELGDGVYAGKFPFNKKTPFSEERYGVLIKANGTPAHFGIIYMTNFG